MAVKLEQPFVYPPAYNLLPADETHQVAFAQEVATSANAQTYYQTPQEDVALNPTQYVSVGLLST